MDINGQQIKDVVLGAKAKDFANYAHEKKVGFVQAYVEGNQVVTSIAGEDKDLTNVLQAILVQLTGPMDTRQTMLFFTALSYDVIALKMAAAQAEAMRAQALKNAMPGQGSGQA